MGADITKKRIVLSVNGQRRELEADPRRSLLDVLREDLDLTGAKRCCDDGECGSCIVLLGSKGVMSCLLPVSRAQGKEITTIEGLAKDGQLHPLQQAFIETGATQCGICIPGMIMQAEALVSLKPNPTRQDVVKHLSRNLCRCTGYVKIIDAVLYAADMMRGGSRRVRHSNGDGHIVGQSILRLDATDKVTGKAKYAADLKKEGMLYAKVLRSPHHHARILAIDASQAEGMPGVEAVVTVRDIPGKATMPNARPQVALLAQDKVRFMGEAVAAVAAVSEVLATEALGRIKVDYEPLPAVFDPIEAMKPEAPLLHPPEPNGYQVIKVVQGDLEKGFAQADVVVENTYSTLGWEHGYLEPEAALAYLDEGGWMVIHAPQHHPFVGRDFIADMLAMDRSRVRIICPAMGGNFGGRGDFEASGIAALLAFRTRKPVKITYTREESLMGSSKGYPYYLKYKTGATKDGKLVALKADLVTNGGSGLTNIERGSIDPISWGYSHCTGPYYIPNVLVNAHEVYTNRPRSVPLRGGHGANVAFAFDSQMDILAARLGLDPVEFRLRNALEVGSITHRGQVLEDSVGIKACLEALRNHYAEGMAWAKAGPSSSPWKRGVGIGCAWYAQGQGGKKTEAAVELLEDGRVRVLVGAVEKGQGVATILAQVAAEALGISLESIVMVLGDTYLAPYRFETNAQATTPTLGGAVYDACQNLRKALTQATGDVLEESPENVVFKNGYACSSRFPDEKVSMAQLAAHFQKTGLPTKYEGGFTWKRFKPTDPLTGHGAICDVYTYCAEMVQVEVNVETGEVNIPKAVYAYDCGTVINPLSFEGQNEGAVVMGLGMALKEKYAPGQTRTLKSYGLPTIRDIPDTLITLSVGGPASQGGPFGAKGGSDMSNGASVPAVINAIAHASGARIYDLPATPEKVLEALGKGRAAKTDGRP